MRLLTAAVLGLSLIAVPAMGQQPDSTGRSYGNVTCPQSVPCDGGDSQVEAVSALANHCVHQYFGYPIGDGFFDEAQGLDTNSCLTAKLGVLPKGIGSQLTPVCCIVQSGTAGQCKLHCDLVSN